MDNDSNLNILLVEDNLLDADLIRRMLSVGMRDDPVTNVCRLSDAFAHLASRSFDVVLLDLGLPDSLGLETLTRFRSQAGDVPVVVLTGNPDEELGLRALKEGAWDFLDKGSANPRSLSRSIRYSIERANFVAAMRDMDERLLQSQKLQALGELAGGVAHEFNNLLQIIGGYTRFALRGLEIGNQRRQDLEQVLDASERAAEIARQLLGFSRRHELKCTEIHPGELVMDLSRMLKPLLGRHIELLVSATDDDVETIAGDPGVLRQALLNLCINARDAMPDGGRLKIGAAFADAGDERPPGVKPGRHLVLTVTDTGGGIPEDVKSRIFDPFFTTKDVGAGTGLGLSVVHGIVEQAGGAILLDSEVGLGTTFTLYFPANGISDGVIAAGDAAWQDEQQPRQPIGGAETILVVDDESNIRALSVRALQDAGYDTLTAENGKQAVRLYDKRSGEIDLVLMDMMMPVMNGRAAFLEIKSRHPEARVIFCSGHDRGMECVDFIKREGLRLIEKPFSSDELLLTVRDALDAGRACATVSPIAIAVRSSGELGTSNLV
jgi:signal transduction histidine kinase